VDVVAWGGNYANELSVPPSATNVVAIYSGGFHGVALRANGTVVVWGNIPIDAGTLPGGVERRNGIDYLCAYEVLAPPLVKKEKI
jgi:alpha-tubulin suppressor-like RCC1 family protein